MRGISVGRILATKNPRLKAGDWATANAGWRELAVLAHDQVTPAKIQPGIKVADLLGVLSELAV